MGRIPFWNIIFDQFIPIWKSLNKFEQFEQVWTSLNKFEQVWINWTSLNKFEQIWTSLNKFEQVWTSLYTSEQVWKSLNKYRIFGETFWIIVVICISEIFATNYVVNRGKRKMVGDLSKLSHTFCQKDELLSWCSKQLRLLSFHNWTAKFTLYIKWIIKELTSFLVHISY